MKPHAQPYVRPLSIYATGDHPCAYLEGRQARTLFVDPRQSLNGAIYSSLVDQGFRRSGDYVYRPGCLGCSACKSLRIPVAGFRLSRRHKRCLAANRDARVQVLPPTFRSEHFELYRRYIAHRHTGSQMADPTPQQYLEFLSTSWGDSLFYEFRENGRLLAVSAVDELNAGLSAVYTFYEPTLVRRSLGTLAIVWLIREAQRLGLDYLYLGYWIAESAKMRYKADFRPHEIFDGRDWRRVD
jgi:arginyl-tRNA--protein-N-Asp/Glu arginylyltransferase